MNNFDTVFPSSQIDSILPRYIANNYGKFVDFMTTASQAQERVGFGQDILQNLQKYRDFDTFSKGIVKYNYLAQYIDIDSQEILLENSYGFPEENGVILIDEEIILYRRREGNKLVELQRGSAGTTTLPTFVSKGNYTDSCAAEHFSGVKVTNLSVLFLASMLDIIYTSFAPGLDPSRIRSDIDQSALLSRIRDFFQSKGTKLGIQSLFKMIFGELLVDVEYPGDEMIVPSVSTYSEDLICRVVPLPSIFYESNEIVSDPGILLGSTIECRSYNNSIVYGSAVVEYTKTYPYADSIQHDLLLNKDSLNGVIIPNPTTTLTSSLTVSGTTITVNSTFGFPTRGILFIGYEAIHYEGRNSTQFLSCSRGRIGQADEYQIGETVFGPYYITGNYITQDLSDIKNCSDAKSLIKTNRSWSTGLVDDVKITDPGLLHSKDDIVTIKNNNTVTNEIKIRVSDISSGNLSNIFIQDPGNNRTCSGDFLYFDNTDTFGVGAEAKVSWLRGECITDSNGCRIQTKLISHRQRLDLSSDINSNKLVFIPGQFIETFGTENVARAIVYSYDQLSNILIVQTITPNLIKPLDSIRDNRGNTVVIFASYETSETDPTAPTPISGSAIQTTGVSNLTILATHEPIKRLNGDDLEPGDLWWSIETGRLYVYYDDGSSTQWVASQPYANKPFGNFSINYPIGYSGNSLVLSGNEPVKSQIIISDTYPRQNPNGSSLRIGDLWWSPITGILYIWNSDTASGGACVSCRCDDAGNIIENTSEWVCTDPTGLLSYGPEGTTSDIYEPSDADPISADVRVIISPNAPADELDATLWWSSEVGRLFVKYDETWVVTNPFGTPSTQYSLYPDGSSTSDEQVGGFFGPISRLPELSTTKELFFTSLCDFYAGDDVKLLGNGREEFSHIIKKNSNSKYHSLDLHRDVESLLLYDGYIMENASRYKLRIETVEPHRLLPGDIVKLYTTTPEINQQEFEVVDVGYITPATGYPVVEDGEIISIVVTSVGRGYISDFYIRINDDTGAGAIAIAKVVNGRVNTIQILDSGVNYSNDAETVFNSDCSIYTFYVYTDALYAIPEITKYEAKGNTLEGYVSQFDLISGGIQYQSLPSLPGIYKRQIDRAKFEFTLSGTTISQVEVVDGGARYVSPQAIILDENGKGNGAVIDLVVENGIIVSADIVSGGIDYENPYIIAIEEGKFIPETNNIGMIKSFDVISEGRDINPNPSLFPTIDVETRLILEYPVENPCSNVVIPVESQWDAASWQEDDIVYYGNDGEATVTHWDADRQVLSVNNLDGEITEGDEISDNLNNTAIVRVSGYSSQLPVIAGSSTISGRFITDKSVLSSSVSSIQDGEYYQKFSYVISSAIQRNRYENFVNSIIHPAGFVYFSKFKLDGNTITDITVNEPSFTFTLSPVIIQSISANIFGTAQWDYPYDIASSPDGNIVVVGEATFGSFSWSDNVVDKNYGSIYDNNRETEIVVYPEEEITDDEVPFIIKYNTNGNIDWVKIPTLVESSLSSNAGSADAVCYLNNNTVVATGAISGASLSFEYGTLDEQILPIRSDLAQVREGFIVNYDNDGNLLWLKGMGYNPTTNVTYSVRPNDISPTNSGGFLVTGVASGNAVFGYGEDNETTFLPNTTPAYEYGFVAKFSDNGEVVWAKQNRSESNSITSSALILPQAITEDTTGAIYEAGWYRVPYIFGEGEANETILPPLPFSFQSIRAGYLSKYDSSGFLQWAKRISKDGSPTPAFVYINDMAYSSVDDTIVVLGAHNGSIILGEGEENETTFVAGDYGNVTFLAKYNTDGNLIWAKKLYDGYGHELAVSQIDATIVVIGECGVPDAIFGEGEENETIIIGVDGGAGYAKYTTNGNLLWAYAPSRENPDEGNDYTPGVGGVSLDANNNIIFCSWVTGSVIFDEGDENETRVGSDNYWFADGYLVRVGPNGKLLSPPPVLPPPDACVPIPISSGLLLYLDVCSASYPESGATTWTDLGPFGLDASLIGPYGYTNNNGGSLIFNKYVGALVELPTARSFASYTLTMWIRPVGEPYDAYMISLNNNEYQSFSIYTDRDMLKVETPSMNYDVSYRVQQYKWHNITIAHTEGGPVRIYIQSILYYESPDNFDVFDISNYVIGGTFEFWNPNWGVNPDGWESQLEYYNSWCGNIAHVSIYDRELTQQEIETFYEDTEPRFVPKATIPPPPSVASLVATPSSIDEGETITVTWTDSTAPTSNDWIGAYYSGDTDPYNYFRYIYTNGSANGSVQFTNFTTVGDIVFRYNPNDEYTSIAESNVVTVNPLPTFEAAWQNCTSLTEFPPMDGGLPG